MQFKKGQSGNPAGRPKGALDRRSLFRQLIEPYKDELVSKAVEMALAGNEQMLRLILERALPAKPKSEPIPPIQLTGEHLLQDGCEVIQQVASGSITPEEGMAVMKLISGHINIIVYEKLTADITALQKKIMSH